MERAPAETTVVLVDDDTAVRTAFGRLLATCGYRVVTTGSFEEARRILRTDVVDVLITDVRLNGRNGLELLATAAKHLPTIVVTGFADAALQAETERLGARFLLKPVEAGTLLQAITEGLSPASDRRAEHADREGGYRESTDTDGLA